MRLNVSQASLFHKCPRRWHNRYVVRKDLVGVQPALLLGTATHKVLDDILLGMARDAAIKTFWHTIGEAHDSLKLDDPAKAKRLVDGAKVIVPVLLVWKDRFEDVVHLGSEVELSAPLGRHEVIGRLDRIVEWHDEVLHYQHKTVDVTINIDRYTRAARLSPHELLYTRLLEYNYPSRNAGGTIYNMIRKARSLATAIARPEELNVQRFIPILPGDVADLLVDLEHDADDMEAVIAGARPRQHRENCLEGFGRMQCPYLGVCLGAETLDNPKFATVADDYTNRSVVEEE